MISGILHRLIFQHILKRNLVYNASWEDPRIDRRLLEVNSNSSIVAITSGGCNILELLLDEPKVVHSVDINPRQNYLLELKKALFSGGSYNTLFQFFGIGSHPGYRDELRLLKSFLRPECYEYWRRNSHMFSGKGLRPSFYWHGTTGFIAWLIWTGISLLPGNLFLTAMALFGCDDAESQDQLYSVIENELWSTWVGRLMCSPFAMALIGVPPAQATLMSNSFRGGIPDYIATKLRNVFVGLPLNDNYFWHVYCFGCYTQVCCPEYLKKHNFDRISLRSDTVHIHDLSISDFLAQYPGQYTHFVLLDHLDWLSRNNIPELEREWQLILANSVPGTKILARSAGDGLDLVPMAFQCRLRTMSEECEKLHSLDRVGTYSSLHLWEVLPSL